LFTNILIINNYYAAIKHLKWVLNRPDSPKINLFLKEF
jgi:hypothetical protein